MTNEELLKELKTLKETYDSAQENKFKFLHEGDELIKQRDKFNLEIYNTQKDLEKVATEKLTEDYVVDKVCKLGDLINERNRLNDLYSEKSKSYLQYVSEVERLKKQIKKAQRQFWKLNGLDIDFI